MRPAQKPMWQSQPLQDFLAGTDGAAIRPVVRKVRPADPTASAAVIPIDRRQLPSRHSDASEGRGEVLASTAVAACAALNQLELAMLLLRSDGQILFANSSALRIAARNDSLRINGLRLKLVDQQIHQVLQTFLSGGPVESTVSGGRLCISSRQESEHCLILLAEWLDVPTIRGSSIASLLIYEPHVADQPSDDMLAQLYGLTKTESRLVAKLFVEPALQAAANGCGMTMNTAKTHLKHVFAKCRVRSKAELLRLLALGPLKF